MKFFKFIQYYVTTTDPELLMIIAVGIWMLIMILTGVFISTLVLACVALAPFILAAIAFIIFVIKSFIQDLCHHWKNFSKIYKTEQEKVIDRLKGTDMENN